MYNKILNKSTIPARGGMEGTIMNNYLKTLSDINNGFIDNMKESISRDKITAKMIDQCSDNDNSKMLLTGCLLSSVSGKIYMIKTLEKKSAITSKNPMFDESEKNLIVVYAYIMGETSKKLEEIKSMLSIYPIDSKKLTSLYDQVIVLLDKNKELMSY